MANQKIILFYVALTRAKEKIILVKWLYFFIEYVIIYKNAELLS